MSLTNTHYYSILAVMNQKTVIKTQFNAQNLSMLYTPPRDFRSLNNSLTSLFSNNILNNTRKNAVRIKPRTIGTMVTEPLVRKNMQSDSHRFLVSPMI